MWALGCVLYTFLVGFPPFYDESIQALTEKVARGQYTFLSPWWDEISLEAKDLISHLLCVNPNERYTIDQFLAHPWIKAGEQSPMDVPSQIGSIVATFAENKVLANVAAMTPDYGAPRTPYKRRAENPLSPGIGLKEVFDVSNAVHRMGEESRRRHTPQPTGHQAPDVPQRQAFMAQLNEEDEDEREDENGNRSGSWSGMSEDDAIAEGISKVQVDSSMGTQDIRALHRQQKEYQLAQERIAAAKHYKYMRQQQQAGLFLPAADRSGKSTISSASSSSNASWNRRRRAGFELNMNQATLLTRRANQQQALPHFVQTVENQNQMMKQPSPVLAV
ncbi:hypothetical protein BGZ65_009431 [Modicella reniformis]|uniref:Protein kinase domain-containing protein n=1 Tax=Modicella reniformis TaxID=1440133 RepID=A0A9P6II06_9FUNG|nr:hypothetical protein BGZ65_009431 [Modicella reniformis]